MISFGDEEDHGVVDHPSYELDQRKTWDGKLVSSL